MASALIGTWKNVSSDNFDAYLKENGVGAIARAAANSHKPTMTIEASGDDWSITASSPLKNHTLKFKIGVEFDEHTADGRDVKSKFTIEGDKLVKAERNVKDGKEAKIERSVAGGQLVVVCTAGSVVSTRKYNKA